MKTSIIGGGCWGTALGAHLAKKGIETLIWAREPEVVSAINKQHYNPKYLSEFKLPENLVAIGDCSKAIRESNIIVLAIPSHVIRQFLELNKNSFLPGQIIVGAAKGIEVDSLKSIYEIVDDIFPPNLKIQYACIAGPSFAKEVLEEQPTAVVIAGRDAKITIEIQKLINYNYLRAYRTSDLIGAEMGGALKNVVAIATGLADGIGFGLNTKAALVTRGLSEIQKIGVRRGAKPETFLGLSGLGDLILTCYGELSRNRTVGFRIGKGERLEDILSSLGQVSEGIITAKSAFNLIAKFGVEAPIFSEVYKILYENKPHLKSLQDLLDRELRPEANE
ncbi:MAG: glycerol-3-phosphate dehydrogenase [Deltaproteobacteria bacterium RIFCSPHIGHO2_12_FULL_43_9]|nr:MAG: glycerol-3-phosphate dehydrogenase [Deltaproteobacteria bacterium RIFCSPHIGHO2_12_FULL_43_9]